MQNLHNSAIVVSEISGPRRRGLPWSVRDVCHSPTCLLLCGPTRLQRSTLAATRVHLVSMVRFRETGKELSLPMTPHRYTPLKSSPLAQGFGPKQRVDPAPGRGRLQKCPSTNSTGTILQPRALLQRRLRLRLSQQLKAHGASIGQSNRAHGDHAGRKRIPLVS